MQAFFARCRNLIAPDILARVPLAPLLVAQAILVRRKALALPEPVGARRGKAGAGAALRLLIVGDSSGAGVGAPSQDKALSGQLVRALAPHFALSWRLEAATGATTGSTLVALSSLKPAPFDIAVVALGVNDVTRAVTQARWMQRQQALHHLLQHRFKVRRIYASGLPPMGLFPLLPQPLRWILGAHSDRLDRGLAAIAGKDQHIRHIPFDLPYDPRFIAADGYHPSPLGYAEWADVLAGSILGDHTK